MTDDLIPGQFGFDGMNYGRARACALAECGKIFVPSREDQLYHSAACRQRAYRRRQGVPRGRGRHRFYPGRGLPPA